MPEQQKADEQGQRSQLDLKKFTMNEVVTEQSRDRAAPAKQGAYILLWVVIILLVGQGLLTWNQMAGRQGQGHMTPRSEARARQAEFQETVVNRSPDLLNLVREVSFEDATTLQAVLFAKIKDAQTGQERPTTQEEWALAGRRLMDEFIKFSPGKELALLLVVEDKPVGAFTYDPKTKHTSSRLGAGIALPEAHQHE